MFSTALFTSAKPQPVATNVNGLRRATKPFTGADIYIRRPNRMPKGLNRQDLISLDLARVRPTLIYGGFLDFEKEIIMTRQSPLDHLARWAQQQSAEYTARATSASEADSVFLSTAFRDDVEDCDSSIILDDAVPAVRQPVAPTMSGPITKKLIPLHIALTRPDIRYRREGFEMI